MHIQFHVVANHENTTTTHTWSKPL